MLCTLRYGLFVMLCIFVGCEENHSTPPAKSTPAPHVSAPSEAAPSVVTPVGVAPTTVPAPDESSAASPATNTKCIVSGEDVDPHDPKLITVVYQGKSYGLCCKDCIEDFKKNPEKYVQK